MDDISTTLTAIILNDPCSLFSTVLSLIAGFITLPKVSLVNKMEWTRTTVMMYLGPDNGWCGDPACFTGQGDGCALISCVVQGSGFDIGKDCKSRSE